MQDLMAYSRMAEIFFLSSYKFDIHSFSKVW